MAPAMWLDRVGGHRDRKSARCPLRTLRSRRLVDDVRRDLLVTVNTLFVVMMVTLHEKNAPIDAS
jgi:hypothetical protein